MGQESHTLYEDDDHQVIWLAWEGDNGESNSLVQSNQLLIINGDTGYMLDPGGAFIFKDVADLIERYIPLDRIRYLIASHQDPDVMSSVTLWMQMTSANLLISRLWTRFVSHFGFNEPERIEPIADEGTAVELPSGDRLFLVPAHFMHSEGNFTVFDERSQTLFSADIGASVFESGELYSRVTDFEEHRRHMQGFHERYMGNNAACRRWVAEARRYPVKRIVPQHGSYFEGALIEEFYRWLEQLECGTDRLEAFYGSSATA
jgi:flavorubredoxin